MRRSACFLAALLLIVSAPAFAAPTPATNSTDESFQHVDPAAWGIVQRAADAYAKLHSYTGTMEEHTVAPEGKNWAESPQRAIIAYKKRNKCSVIVQNDSGIWSSVSDGLDVYTLTPLSAGKQVNM